jgi:hypothetical protein
VTRLYRIICLKRTSFKDHVTYKYTSQWFEDSQIVYWKPNARGYTNERDLAGLYTGLELEEVCGEHLDWLADPVSSEERFPTASQSSDERWGY